MKAVFCASEVYPYAKTGGLADVCGALPLALEDLGLNAAVFLPRYQGIDRQFPLKEVASHIFKAALGQQIDVYFIDHKGFFDRPGIYGDAAGDFPDNLERFQHFSWAVLEALKTLNIQPQVVHCHDWHTALIPVYLKENLQEDPFYKGIRSVLTIHNLAFQGIFPKNKEGHLRLPAHLHHPSAFDFHGQVNLLKAGILYADEVTTVSPQYAKEIQTKEYGCGLEHVLHRRQKQLMGIINGLDYKVWGPEKDPLIKTPYGLQDVVEGKRRNKAALQKALHLPVADDIPLFGFVGRLTHQKGVDLIIQMLEKIDGLNIQLAIQGEKGDGVYAQRLRPFASNKVGLNFVFNERVAHEVYAGSDFLIMPSLFEPCGLSQMIAMRYGTPPIAYATGGLIDTIKSWKDHPRDGNGLLFKHYTPDAFIKAMGDAVKVFENKTMGQPFVQNAMRADFSWQRSAQQYKKLYQCL